MPALSKTIGRAQLAALVLALLAGPSVSDGTRGTGGAAKQFYHARSHSAEVILPRAAPLVPEEAPIPLPVAIFGDDLRQPIRDLRQRDPGTLGVEELAILQAAGRMGSLTCKGGSTNASLIRLADGRDAVITSAHSFIDEAGEPKCDLSGNVQFMPNVSFHIGGDFTEFVLRLVPTTGELPLNIENTVQGNFISPLARSRDFLVFTLAETISNDILPDGSGRGFMRVATDIPRDGTAFLIGLTTEVFDGLTPGFESCGYRNAAPEFYHLCATNAGTSSSPLMIFDGRELVLAGVHTRSQGMTTNLRLLMPNSVTSGNIGISMDTVRAYLDIAGRPAVTAPFASVVSP